MISGVVQPLFGKRGMNEKGGGGVDYWSARPGNAGFCNCPGKGVKQHTHRLERRCAEREIRIELEQEATS